MADLSELQAAITTATAAPHDSGAWQDAENLAADLDRPDDIVAAYRTVLATELSSDIAELVGERAGSFCDEWFGDDPAIVESLLLRVVELAPRSDSALQRLSTLYTVNERWNELLALYDRMLKKATDPQRRIRLLREASQLAKDVANQPDKAISYQQQLLPLVPDDAQLSQSLERLLERHERWADLIKLWESKLDGQSKPEREKSRARIAGVWLDNLADPASALTAVKPLLAAAVADTDADRDSCDLLTRIVASPHATKQVREGALDLLRSHYDAHGRARDMIAVLETVISIEPQTSKALREEAGDRLAELDDVDNAMRHFAAILAQTPESAAVEERLRQLADRGGNYLAYAEGVANAASASADPTRAVDLYAKAAKVRADRLRDTDGAIALYEQASKLDDAADQEKLVVTRRLNTLYGQADRQQDRLAVLEKQAALEPVAANKAALFSEAAKLAESLGQADRALSLWERRAESDPSDVSGLDARVALLENQGRWDELVATLEDRAAKRGESALAKMDLIAIAQVHEQKRNDIASAIDAWQRVVAGSPTDAEAVTALADLLAKAERWEAFSELVSTATARESERIVERLVSLGDAQRLHLAEPAKAMASYRNAVAIASRHRGALDGLRALLTEPSVRGQVADALAITFARNQDEQAVLDLLPARLAEANAAGDRKTELMLLREAASVRLSLQGAAGQRGALADLASALPLAPRDQLIEKQISELADATDQPAVAAQAFAEGIAALVAGGASAADPDVVRLKFLRADLLSVLLGDQVSASTLYNEIATAVPGDRRAAVAAVVSAGELQRWPWVASAMLRHAERAERFDEELWSQAQALALGAKQADGFAAAIDEALGAISVPRAVAAQTRYRLASLRRDYLRDTGGAIVDMRRALELAGDRASWLAELAQLEREGGPAMPLLDALRRQSEAEPTNLDVLIEAANVARQIGDQDATLSVTSQVLSRAAMAWRGTAAMQSDRPFEAVATEAVQSLVEQHRNAGRPRAAIDVLQEASRLPYSDEDKRGLRLRAADIAANDLGDRSTAIDIYRGVLALSPNDTSVLARLGDLLASENRIGELLIVRQAQLDLETDPATRLGLRLEKARLVGVIEETGGRLAALVDNLQEAPGHDESVDAVVALLSKKGEHRELATLLEGQAQKVEDKADTAKAARLWSRAATVAEQDSKEPERAIAAHRRAVALVPNADSLRALARLNLNRNLPGQAVPWLESLLATVSGAERLAVVSQLAKAHLAAKNSERAITAIQMNLPDGEAAPELRNMLAELYRKAEQWEPLARHLTQSLPLLASDQERREAAREAATVYVAKLNEPVRAIPALRAALALEPTDKELRTQLAVGQRLAGNYEEARTALSELINDFGRRRSPERAVLHMELAKVAQAQGNLDEAINEMDQASKMDANNASIQRELAEMSRKVGQLDRAERTYRALLLVVRRTPPGDDLDAVGQSEVLFELHKLAAVRGEEDQSKDLLQSALDAASQSDAETRRFRRSLLAHSEGHLLLGVIEQRLKANTEAASQALLLSDMAEILLGIGRKEDALAAVMRAAALAPGNRSLHEQARNLAKETGATRTFVEGAEALADKLRRKDDPPLIADILMRAGLALEQDAKDLPGAQALYRRVEMSGERLAESYFAQARIAQTLGDTAEQTRALDKMAELANQSDEAGELSSEKVEALYRLAEVFVATPARRGAGIDLLEKAFAAEPRWNAAGQILRAAAGTELLAEDERVLKMYERVARTSGDQELLLDFLERRAGMAGASSAQIREAVDVAVAQGEAARAERLLRRAVDQARNSSEGLRSDIDSALALAERRFAVNDSRMAFDLLYEVASVEPGASVDDLANQIATRALAERELALAAEVYEFMRERKPSDRSIWQPLLTIYRETKDADRLGSVVSSTLPQLAAPAEREAMRLEHASFLMDTLKRNHDAAEVLREGLLDTPDSIEMASRYERVLRELGDNDAIAEFLWQRFDDAQRRGSREATVDVAIRLGDLLTEQGSNDVARVYRAALVVAPDDREILRRVVSQINIEDDPREGAVLMERLLAVETPEDAPALAAKVAEMWHAAGDMRAVQRTLEIANRSAPDDKTIHDRLERHYRDNQMWSELAELMVRDAERSADDTFAVDRLRAAAAVYTGTLSQPRKAAEVLKLARARSNDADSLVTDQAAALAAAGDLDGAQRALADAMQNAKGASKVALLLLRSSFLQQLGDDVTAVSDLQEAYEIDANRSVDTLLNGLERLRVKAEQRRDTDGERAATLQIAKLSNKHGDADRARDMLVGWIEKSPQDDEPLYMLIELDAAIGHAEGVLASTMRLAYITGGEAQVDAAMRCAQAASDAGRPGDALPVLEMVHQAQPGAAVLRNKLRDQYEASGAFRELAGVLTADADHAADKAERYAAYRRAAELLLYNMQDPAAATYAAGKALEMQPDDYSAIMLNVDVLLGSGQVEVAGRTLDAAIAAQKKRTPELAIMQQRMARVSAMQGDQENHIGWLKKAFDVDRKNAEIAAELAQVATEIGDYELALKPLRAITLMENPLPVTRPMALLWEAKIEHARGNKAKAELWAKKALREDPNFSEAQTFIEEIGG